MKLSNRKNRPGVTSIRAARNLTTGYAGVIVSLNKNTINRLIVHASKSLTTRTYTHKDIEELRQAIE